MANTGVKTNVTNTMPVKVDSDLSAKQYYFVDLDTTDDEVVNLVADAASFGWVLLEGVNGSSTTKNSTIAIEGIVKVKSGGAISAGDKITATTGGAAIATTTDTNHYNGIAMENAASGDLFAMKIEHGMVAG